MKKKSFTVVARNKRSKYNELFKGKGSVQVYDSGVADEIKSKYGKDVGVVEDERHEWHLKNDKQTNGHNLDIHHYTFSGVDMKKRGGNERVKVKTADGYTFVSRDIAEEHDMEIVEETRKAGGIKPSEEQMAKKRKGKRKGC